MAVSSTGVRFDFLGRDVSAGRTAAQVDRKFSALGSTAATVGKAVATGIGIAAVGGVTALGAAMVKGVKAAQSYQTLALKTAAVIKSTGNQARISVKGVQGLAAELETLSGVDEELIINSQNVLATFTKIRNETGKSNDIFNQATKAALNMSTALGTDLQGASIQVGKALNDPIKGVTALQRVGVSFTQKQRDQIKTLVESGRTMQAQKLILAELNVEFGGAAKAAGGGFGGALARAQDAGSDLARDIGVRVLPKLTEFADWFTVSGVPKMRSLVSYTEKTLVPRVVTAVGGLKGKVQDVLPDLDWSGLGRGLRDSAESWSGELLGGLQTGFDKGDWKPLGDTLGRGIGKALGAITTGSGEAAKAIGRWFSGIDWFNVGASVGKQAFPFALGFFIHMTDEVVSTAKKHPLEAALAPLFILGIGRLFGKMFGAVKALPGGKLIGAFMEMWYRATKPMNDALDWFFRMFTGGFVRRLNEMFPFIRGNLGKRLTGLADTVRLKYWEIRDATLKFLKGIPDGIGSGTASVVGSIARLIWRMTSPFRRSGTWLIGAGRSVIGGLLGGIRNAMGGVGGWIKSVVVDPIVRGVKHYFGIKSPSRVMMGIGGHLITGLVQGMARQNPGAIAGKIFGGMPQALGAIVDKGLVSIRGLPGKALDALSGLGGKFAGLLDGVGGLLGFGGGSSSGLVEFGRWLQAMGYTVTEHPMFGGVTAGAHVRGSQHYIGQAIDVNRGAGTSVQEQRWLSRIIGPAHEAGFRTIFMAPGHYNHAHVAMAGGGVIGEPVFGRGAWSGRSYSFAERGDETVIPGGPRGLRGGGGLHLHVHIDGVVAGSTIALENAIGAAVDRLQSKGKLRLRTA